MNSDAPLPPGSRVAIAGASGLIGSALARSLTADGHEVVRLVRRAPRGKNEVRWDPGEQRIDSAGLVGCAAVVNLAGAGVASRRWTDAYKQTIRSSRVLGTATLAEAIASLDEPPAVFVSGSAIGFYGDTGDRAVDETAPPGDGFLPALCVEWEEAAEPAQEAGVRTVFTRTGLVVAAGGGAWGRLFPLFKAGLGGRMGDGRQYWSYISLHDEVAAIRHVIDTASLSGPVNLTAPTPLTNAEITAAMGRVLHRPTLFTAPAPVLRAALGDMAGDILGSQRVLPARLLESGFAFAFPGIEETLRSALR
ncbi:epimerase [Streptomyces avermitilis]|uniref:NAD dependent epimerase/dehydratase family n=2 Tax=Streptomyces avermitilis TaxID=33903 RepID=Q82AP3_STRAW|nr:MULTISPECIES: TIGR01777 family oxidoreductase [Streptomyces]KUN54426.1 epimerase [Streptomyces avermitilis]MYT01568.1 TIGR01777 family protein [Streptomyces sp. SID5469]OOV28095.1 TIGR01777 family protein [Streptomyces avermitilis]BAC73725.1 putative NAD dependent epimerase/dehydratase family [Streptomyces avermitilis MA-4680 = NBRC 14893]BBJ54219.1 epimerase [Streptomyces avermitilis]